MSQPGRGSATSRPSLRLLRDDRVRDIGVPPSPMPCCGCHQTAERTMTWQDSSPQPNQAWHRARGRQGPVLAILAMLAPKPGLCVAPGCSALPLTAALRGALCCYRPGRRNGASTEQRNAMCNSLDALESDIVEQVRIQCPKRTRASISLHSEVYKDLGICGMDVFEIIVYIHKKYGTKFSNLDLNDYVPPETAFLRLWKAVGFYRDRQYDSLTIQHLVEAARRGAWIEPSTND
jgi:Protein of unknown function (DUF1493)